MIAVPSKGLFIDLDGTLADSLSVMRTAYGDFLKHFGKTGSDVEFDLLNGPPLKTVVITLAEVHCLSPSIDELILIYRDIIKAAYKDVCPNIGAVELLKTAKDLGWKIGVVTSNSGNLTWAWLGRFELNAMVDTVVAGGEVTHGKPHPLPYLLALARTECLADISLAVEDSTTGAQASMAAGLQTLFLCRECKDVLPGAFAISTLKDATTFLVEKHQQERAIEQ